MAEFKVPKDRQDVTIHLENGISMEGAIFLEPSPFELTAYQRVGAMIEDENSFFPLALNKTDGGVEFINKKNVKIVECDCAANTEKDEFSLSLMHIENISAIFNDGSSVSGAFMAEVPADKARLSDCLNLQTSFISLRVNDKLFYINKNHLQRVVYSK